MDGFYPEKSKMPIFDNMLQLRRKEARASVVVEVRSFQSKDRILQACSGYGTIRNMYYHQLPDMNLFVVELDSEDAVRRIQKSCKHTSVRAVIPSVSPFMWLEAVKGNAQKTDTVTDQKPASPDLQDSLFNAKSVSDQIGIYESHTRLSEVDYRLRWVTCTFIEQMLSGLFPFVRATPFGSSINGCGRKGSDLDMYLTLENQSISKSSDSPWMFQVKACNSDQRQQVKKNITFIGDILQNFAPGFVGVQRITGANVPILKFRQQLTAVDCDLSLTSGTAICMSELIHLYGEIDWRFRPLVASVRLWAKCSQLTSSNPGPHIKNFTLTLLVIYFLQTCRPAILPTVNEMTRLARPKDRRFVDNVDCTFLRDPSVFMERSFCNTQSLEELLVGFLEFVEKFAFDEHAISVIWGDVQRKADASPLYVQNPIERELNVSKNANKIQVLRLSTEACNALHRLQSGHGQHWGILSMFSQSSVKSEPPSTSARTIGLDLKDIFNHRADGSTPNSVKRVKTKNR